MNKLTENLAMVEDVVTITPKMDRIFEKNSFIFVEIVFLFAYSLSNTGP